MTTAQSDKIQALLPWHTVVWQRLVERFPNIGHGLLFYGKEGCGKQQFAEQFSQWLLCTDKQGMSACGHCASCRWIAAGTHPQLKRIAPDFDEKKQSYAAIKIDQIREMGDFVQQRVEGWRVVLIEHAEYLNIAASNALLKTLEEPGERVVIILVSDAMLKLPATIRSRVQQYALDRILSDQAQAYLAKQTIVGADDNAQNQTALIAQTQTTAIALSLAAEMPLKAEQILQTEWFRQRQSFVDAWIDLVNKKAYPMLFSTQWSKQLDFRELLVMLRYLIQDCIALKLQQSVKQTDLQLGKLEKFYSLQQLFAIYAQINKINGMLLQNVQTQLIFDELTVQLMNVDFT
ncbi:DNA polymerase III subunit delta' [Acinetobacter puyangensis]|uniref:DNA-directed DNA polymerase n=1 Tax=Acinetobacter puyangensis TaxID=1096779 RepID=A0A240EB73_9GAMM|nr:DNA polymerase III subunit delta' [Acinetobacter puyangensis]SNX45523.1 DNA polymerase-3 subunit delta' [Acinetobacter puyangensis]